MSIRDRLKGAANEIGGRIKEATGAMTDDERLRREGRVDQDVGQVRKEDEKLKGRVEGTMDTLKGRVERVGGAITGDTSTEAKGHWDEFKGNVKRKINE